MKKYDLVILLGSQIKCDSKEIEYFLAPHTALKTEAAAIAYKKEITRRFIISGGYNFGVRYDYEKILKFPDFSFEAFAKARGETSEAEVIRDCLIYTHGIPQEAMFLEDLSSNTSEQAEILKILLKLSLIHI